MNHVRLYGILHGYRRCCIPKSVHDSMILRMTEAA